MPAATAYQFGIFLRKLRQREGLSQSTLASYLNVDHAIISRIETGNLKPPLDSAFYDQLRTVPGFTEADVTLLLNATEADKSTETAGELLDQLIAKLDRLWNLQLASSLSGQKFLRDLVSTYVDSASRFSMVALPRHTWAIKQATQVPPATSEEEVQEPSPESFTDPSIDAIISALMAPEKVEPGDHLAKHISDLQSQAKFGAETNQRPVPYPHENVVFHVAQLQAEALRKQGAKKRAEKSYEVVSTLRQAADKTGVPHDEILTTRDIEAEYHINKKLVQEYTQRGRRGRPHLTPLDVRLSGGGGGQLLFRRGDIERVVANPPKPGRTPK